MKTGKLDLGQLGCGSLLRWQGLESCLCASCVATKCWGLDWSRLDGKIGSQIVVVFGDDCSKLQAVSDDRTSHFWLSLLCIDVAVKDGFHWCIKTTCEVAGKSDQAVRRLQI